METNSSYAVTKNLARGNTCCSGSQKRCWECHDGQPGPMIYSCFAALLRTVVRHHTFEKDMYLNSELSRFPVLMKINPSMSVWIDIDQATHYKDRQQWIKECVKVFFNEEG